MKAVLHDMAGKQRGTAAMPEGTHPEVLLVWVFTPDGQKIPHTFIYSHSKKDPEDKQGERILHYREVTAQIIEQKIVGAEVATPRIVRPS